MTRAHEESSIKALRVGDAWRKKKDDARTGTKQLVIMPRLWLTHNDGVYVINEPRADVVRRIFQMSIDGYGKIAIAKALNAESIASFKGGTWATSSLQKLLTNKAVIGEYQPHTGKWPHAIPVGDPIPATIRQSLTVQPLIRHLKQHTVGVSAALPIQRNITTCGKEFPNAHCVKAQCTKLTKVGLHGVTTTSTASMRAKGYVPPNTYALTNPK